MAPSLHRTEPPGTPPRTAIGEPAFRFSVICDDDDDDQDQAGGGQDGRDNHGDDTEPLLSTAAFLHPHHATPLRPLTPEHTPAMATEDRLASGGISASPPKNPFNFQTQFISTAPVKSSIGQRRGHRYKHSSISAQHQIFQEPPPRPPPVLPASLPIPTLKEAWASMQREQRARLWWCCCHAAVAMYVFFAAEGSLAMTALSHLVFFDVGSAAVCVAVDVLGNFEVWRRSSIRHPFGLQRAEVLAGFAMSVFLVFGGFDLISHNLKHFLETVGEHVPHHPTAGSDQAAHAGHAHHARYVSPGTVDFASLAAVVSTLVSAYGLRNHGRIRRVMRVPFPYLASLLPGAGLLANPFHFLTLCFSFLLLLLPLVSVPLFLWLDRLICAAIAASMFVLGTRLAVAQGLMLLMSYSGGGLPSSSSSATAASQDPRISHSEKKKLLTTTTTTNTNNTNHTISSVLREIESDPQVARVEEAQFWQVHYGLAMANLKVVVNRHHHHHPSSSSSSTGHGGGGTNGTGNGAGAGAGGGMDDDGGAAGPAAQLSQLRGRLARVVQNRLGEGGYGRGGSLRWEVTVQFCSDG